MNLSPLAQSDVLDALSRGVIPEEFWDHEDDACDCVYQRIGMWKNPYLGETLEVRMCCIWKELYQLFPQFVRSIPGYFDEVSKEWDESVREWDAEYDMPKSIWYRQMARKENISVAEAREKYRDRDEERPRGRPRPRGPIKLSMSSMLAIEHLNSKMQELQAQMAAVLIEAGCDADKNYHIAPDGTVTEVTNDQGSDGNSQL